jgi:glutamate carboxypeptidase
MNARTIDQAATWLREQAAPMERALAELVQVNSFTDNVEGGNVTGRALDALFSMPGLEQKQVHSARYADHRVYLTGGAPGQPPVALIGHLDTVFPPGTFEGYRRDGDLARGPGVLDMKGGLVVVAWALRAIAETHGLERARAVRLVVVGDEEVGSPEGKRVIEETIVGSTDALVFEAGRAADAIITRRKGTGMLRVRAQGKAAHAGNAHRDGVNAIWALARFIEGAQRATDYAKGVTVNVGKISGGTSKNTVPDDASAEIDLRFETRADAESLLASLHEHAARVMAEMPGAILHLEGGVARLPLERTAASAALLERYRVAAERAGLGGGEAALIGGGSDASTSHAMGIASIDGLGPRGAGFHTKDEHIIVASLVPKAEALMRFLLAHVAPADVTSVGARTAP